MYMFGIGVAHYLGYSLQLGSCIEGFVWISAILISSSYLGTYFKIVTSEFGRQKNEFHTQSETDKVIGKIFLLTGISSLAVSLIPLLRLFTHGSINPITIVILIMTLGITFFSDLFPLQIASSGLLEFLQAIRVANLIPVISFTLQVNGIHKLLFLLTFPLLFAFIALFILIPLPELENGENKRSLIDKLGSVNLLKLENLLVLFTYLIFLVETILDLPWKLIWPALIALPIGLLQVWQVNQIIHGHKPSFTPLLFNAYATAGFTAYFILLALWLN